MKLNENQLAEYDQRGFLFYPGLLGAAEVAVLREALEVVLRHTGPKIVREEKDPSSVRLAFGAEKYNDVFRRLSQHPKLLSLSEHLLRSKVHIFQSRINPKAGFSGNGWGWHQDFNQWYRHDGMQHPRAIMVGVFLDDITAVNAPLMVIPGSQRRGHMFVADQMELDHALVEELVAESGIEALMGPAGSVMFLDCNLVHGSTPNMSPFRRCICYFNYNSVLNTEIEHAREHRSDSDCTPLEMLDESCLLEPSSSNSDNSI